MKLKLRSIDYHMVFNGETNVGKLFDSTGHMDHIFPALMKGQHGDSTKWGGDTPPGRYVCGVVYPSREEEPDWIWNAYGEYCIDLIDLDNQERGFGREGISIHGGGSLLVKQGKDPLDDFQPLLPTHGCIRVHNFHLREWIIPLFNDTRRKVYVTVYQP